MSIQTAAIMPAQIGFLSLAATRIEAQQATLQQQEASGVASDSYAGLGDQRYTALNLQPEITKLASYKQNVTVAQGTLTVTQTAISQITTIATDLQTSLTSLVGDSSTANVSLVASEARQSLQNLASLMNTQNGTQYVFAGSASSEAPVTDPGGILDSTLFTSIGAAVAGVTTADDATSAEEATTEIAGETTSGVSVFSAALSTGVTAANALTHKVAVGDQNQLMVGFVATAGSLPAANSSDSQTSTGSPIRDLMRALAVVGNLDQVPSSGTGLSQLIKDTNSQVGTVSSALDLVVASLGATQQQLTAQTGILDHTNDALTTQLGQSKDVDAATLSVQLSETQTQLQASYSLIADMKGMSLAAYL